MELIIFGVVFLVRVGLATLVSGGTLYLAWGAVAVPVFGAPALTFGQAVAVALWFLLGICPHMKTCPTCGNAFTVRRKSKPQTYCSSACTPQRNRIG
jgi:hypothetical protein